MNNLITNPEVINVIKEASTVTLSLQITEHITYFQGHFPDAPILAGVVQLDWAISYAREMFDLTEREVEEVQVLKFQNVIVPNSLITLRLVKKSPSKIVFEYESDKGNHASGRIVFEGA
ncbi:hypothetical protein [Pseudoalteromonas luteoviolacea]|uniref:ApeI dehydratase-like domain-containing protein n=1 Tax=Pseudoalteromonas luteoviolacea NCIMB 1942 TaxID=1365253 RepID=A0A167DAR5_9GAMM|nr:hypothetical protein [Pseudoalteromonas luteoviolacea]KZN48617.1 hypothetical protein N482_07230 [Pseudoalteromonas luteoviolacea NCIMB 1942]KZX00688.1 hypothetical protein JL49_09235 [Pseudoalteromonas luteoviolacea]